MGKIRVLIGILCLLAFPASGRGQRPDPCPVGRTLERQVATADVVILGEVTYDRDCGKTGIEGGRVVFDCQGRRADVRVIRSWKGGIMPGEGLALVIPAPSDSTSLRLNKGDRRVIFATARQPTSSGQWWGRTDACYLPEGNKSNKELQKQLDTWKRAQKKAP